MHLVCGPPFEAIRLTCKLQQRYECSVRPSRLVSFVSSSIFKDAVSISCHVKQICITIGLESGGYDKGFISKVLFFHVNLTMFR